MRKQISQNKTRSLQSEINRTDLSALTGVVFNSAQTARIAVIAATALSMRNKGMSEQQVINAFKEVSASELITPSFSINPNDPTAVNEKGIIDWLKRNWWWIELCIMAII